MVKGIAGAAKGHERLLARGSVLADLGHCTVVEVLLVGLAHGPGLLLMHRIAAGVGVVVTRDLGQHGTVAPTLALVGGGPGQKLAGWPWLASCIGRQGDRAGGIDRGGVGHHTDLEVVLKLTLLSFL
jgi:hypothetical protein